MGALRADESDYQELLGQIQEEFPRFRLICKRDSGFQRLIDRVLRILTFGGMTSYLDSYVTTLGQRVYVYEGWDDRDPRRRISTLRHERVHMRQFRRYSVPIMALLYVMLPLPAGLAYFRARFEMEAYAESIRADAELFGTDHVRDESYRERLLSQFTGPSYGWMWPFRGQLLRWYSAQLAGLPA